MNNKIWEYRVVRSKKYNPSDDNSVEGYEKWLSVQEVYYDEDEKPTAQTIDLQVEGESISELRKQLQMMLWSLDKEVIDEIENETDGLKTIEERVLDLEIENTKLRDRLTDLSNKIQKLGTDGHGNDIYESNDRKGILRKKGL